MSEAHKKNRRILEWAFPGRMAGMSEAWDGAEDYQTFLNRACEWAGAPVTAAEIAAKEADYDAHMAVAAKPKVISFDDFEARFTPTEWDAATDYVYEIDIVSGKPKRRGLIQGLARAQARNTVDLLDAKTAAFLQLLVVGGVVTAARKAQILDPAWSP